jgi:antirestriction protein ArdC
MNTPPTSNQHSGLYTCVTECVVADLERGVRPWLKPWTSGSSRIARPRRHNGMPYRGTAAGMLRLPSKQPIGGQGD